MEGKPGEGRRKETPAPRRWRFCGSVTCLPAPRPVVLGGGVSPGLCVTLGYLDPWRRLLVALGSRRTASLLVAGMPCGAVLGTPGATVPDFPVPAHGAGVPDCPRAAPAP